MSLIRRFARFAASGVTLQPQHVMPLPKEPLPVMTVTINGSQYQLVPFNEREANGTGSPSQHTVTVAGKLYGLSPLT
jgi:hypothetical protein